VVKPGRLDPPGDRLPDFPWDRLVSYAATARSHPDGLCDLSVGTPVDPTPALVQDALRAAADSPGYPTTIGTAALREAAAGWLVRRAGAGAVDPATEVLPCIGSKELVALLPLLVGVQPGSRLLFPELAYPTYEVGARLAGALPEACADVTAADPDGVALVWLNSPSNPAGQMLGAAQLRAIVDWGREHGVLIVSDECYLEFGWDAEPVSLLRPDVCGGSHQGLLVVHSLSKRSNLAGYRGGFVAGDRTLIATLLEIRKHLGLLVPGPVQAAMTAALSDDSHVEVQRGRYLRRRALLRPALEAAGFRIDHSLGGLYLWATRGEPCMLTVGRLAELGILVAPGDFYGTAGAQHVRIALTATDERIEAAADRLAS
jgi:succinyldiaminopimelate transaminase